MEGYTNEVHKPKTKNVDLWKGKKVVKNSLKTVKTVSCDDYNRQNLIYCDKKELLPCLLILI